MKKLILIAASALFLGACSSVSQSDFDALKAQVDSNTQMIEQANQTAQQANVAAQDAKVTAMQTEEKLNRVFRRAQMK